MAEHSDQHREAFVKYRGVRLTPTYEKYSEIIENFEIRDDDVWLCGFQKTGTTWTEEMIWCLKNDLDFEGAMKMDIRERYPMLELQAIAPWQFFGLKNPEEKLPEYETKSLQIIAKASSPRFIKTHLPFNLLPRDLRERKTKAKIVYVTRNPKDTLISMYHFMKYAFNSDDSLEDCVKLFLEDRWYCCPFWEHVLEFLKHKNHYGNQMFINKFEDMKVNLPEVIRKLTKFLDKPPLSPDDLDKLVDHLSFEKMKKNPSVNYEAWMNNQCKLKNYERAGEFIRCGGVGQWETELSEETCKKFDERTLSTFEPINFTFDSNFNCIG